MGGCAVLDGLLRPTQQQHKSGSGRGPTARFRAYFFLPCFRVAIAAIGSERTCGLCCSTTSSSLPLVTEAVRRVSLQQRGANCDTGTTEHGECVEKSHFSHTWLDRGGAEGDLMELNGWSSPQMLRRYGASARARRTYNRVMEGSS
jgi:hypothetical protein